MRTNDEALLEIKYKVLYEVAKLAFAGTLDEEKHTIPYKLVPGPKAQFRCCIYKEREILRQRVRLAEGKCPKDIHSDNMVQVISSFWRYSIPAKAVSKMPTIMLIPKQKAMRHCSCLLRASSSCLKMAAADMILACLPSSFI